jgi:hypothetical protein
VRCAQSHPDRTLYNSWALLVLEQVLDINGLFDPSVMRQILLLIGYSASIIEHPALYMTSKLLTTRCHLIGRRKHVAYCRVGSHRIEERTEHELLQSPHLLYLPYRNMRGETEIRERGGRRNRLRFSQRTSNPTLDRIGHCIQKTRFGEIPNPPEKDNSQFRMSQTALTYPYLSEKGLSVSFISFVLLSCVLSKLPRTFHLSITYTLALVKAKRGLSGTIGSGHCQEVSGIM